MENGQQPADDAFRVFMMAVVFAVVMWMGVVICFLTRHKFL